MTKGQKSNTWVCEVNKQITLKNIRKKNVQLLKTWLAKVVFQSNFAEAAVFFNVALPYSQS